MKKNFYWLPMLISSALSAQQLPLQSQYFLNPYLYQPALAGAGGYTEVFLTHRQQWLGIEGAPVTSALSVHLPTAGKLAFGVNLLTDKYGLLTSTSTLFTTAYRVQLGEESYLRAGLSLGAALQGIDAGQLENPKDQAAMADYSSSNAALVGNAGLHYQWRALEVGLALPSLFDKKILSRNQFNEIEVGALNACLLTGGYKFELSPDLTLQPQLLYWMGKGIVSQYEALGVVYWQEKVWLGGSYRQRYGPTAVVGARIGEKIKVGYAYEIASSQVQGFAAGAHELTLSVRFGSKKGGKATPAASQASAEADQPNTKVPMSAQKPRTDQASAGAAAQKKATPSAGLPASKPVTPKPAAGSEPGQPAKKTIVPTTKPAAVGGAVKPKPAGATGGTIAKTGAEPSKAQLEMKPGHYVIMSSFKQYDAMVKSGKTLLAKGQVSQYGYYSPRLNYYLYSQRSEAIEDARLERDRLRQVSGFEEAWILIVK